MFGKRGRRRRRYKKIGRRLSAIEREAMKSAEREEAWAGERRQRAEALELEAAELAATDPSRAADLLHDADLERAIARGFDETSALAADMAER